MGRIWRRATSVVSKMHELCGVGVAKGLYARGISSISSFFSKRIKSMHNSMCRRDIVGEESDHVKQVLFSDFTYSFTMFM